MNAQRRLKIAGRISALLERELQEGIDAPRMAVEPLYARDVLLVCEALPGTDGPMLAAQFRAADSLPASERPAPGQEPVVTSASRFLNSIFGQHSTLELPKPGPLVKAKGWLARARGSRGTTK
jgi:hypothetical protein